MTATFLILAAIAVAACAAAMSPRNAVHCVLLAGMILVIPAQSQIAKVEGARSAGRAQVVGFHPQVEAGMAAKIESSRYCKVYGKTGSLRIVFKLAFKNSTSAAITIWQPIYAVPFVSRTLQDLRRGKYEFTLYAPDPEFSFPAKLENKALETAPSSQQTNVKPGKVFTGQTMETDFPIPLTEKFSKRDALTPGIHFVQLQLDSEIQGTKTFARFTSQPFEINVDRHPKVEKCR